MCMSTPYISSCLALFKNWSSACAGVMLLRKNKTFLVSDHSNICHLYCQDERRIRDFDPKGYTILYITLFSYQTVKLCKLAVLETVSVRFLWPRIELVSLSEFLFVIKMQKIQNPCKVENRYGQATAECFFTQEAIFLAQ